LRGVKANALTYFIRSAKLKITERIDARITLDYLIEFLKEVKDLSITDYSALEDLVKNIPTSNENQKKEIIRLFQSKPVYEFTDMDKATWKYIKNIPKTE
jgi:hypothetical protein